MRNAGGHRRSPTDEHRMADARRLLRRVEHAVAAMRDKPRPAADREDHRRQRALAAERGI